MANETQWTRRQLTAREAAGLGETILWSLTRHGSKAVLKTSGPGSRELQLVVDGVLKWIEVLHPSDDLATAADAHRRQLVATGWRIEASSAES